MRELAVELKQLRMHGMAGAWADLVEQGGSVDSDTVPVRFSDNQHGRW